MSDLDTALETPAQRSIAPDPVVSTGSPPEMSEPPSTPAANEESASATESPVDTEPPEPPVSLDLVVVDSAGRLVPRLPLRVMRFGSAGKVLVVEASTDSKGAIAPITTLPVGTRFEVQIKNDRGVYMMAAIGTVQSQRMTGNLMLPHQRFEFATYSHDGARGTAEKVKQSTAGKHTQQVDGKVDVARNAPAAPTVTLNRNEQGNPKAIVSSGNKNMLGQNRMSTSNPNLGLSAPEKVKALIDFGMEQLTWVHPREIVSEVIIQQMKASTYTYETRPKALGYAASIRRCAKYVKIALWKAGYIPRDGDFDPATSPASKLGPGLLRAGFADVTGSLPDARWAAPGDVIVYRKIGAPEADGHIDIRTYDGYLSDFWDSYLPVSLFEVTGIYRKYFDPVPEKRMRAFLKVIRTREAETVFATSGDPSTYRALPMTGGYKRGEPPPTFDSFKEHPFANSTVKGLHASGAYGITLDSWRRTLAKWVKVADSEDKFSPVVQDRIAVALMELHPGVGYAASHKISDTSSLGLIRMGRVTEAAKQLSSVSPVQWSSLPGGKQTRGYTLDDFNNDFKKFFDELH